MATFRQPATYRAVYRTSPRPYGLSWAPGAAGRKQIATISHAATALKTVVIRKALVAIESTTGAAIIHAELVRLTDNAAATGNPAITPIKAHKSDPTAEATCLALPTTPGTEEAGPYADIEWNLGVTAAASVVNPPAPLNYVDLLSDPSNFSRVPVIRKGQAEGWAITLDASAASTIVAYAVIEFTEEALEI